MCPQGIDVHFELASTNRNKARHDLRPITGKQSWRSIRSVSDSNRISVYNKKEGRRIVGFLLGFWLRISTDFLEDGKCLFLSVRIVALCHE